SNRRFVSLIEEDSIRLGRLIEDLLTLSQVESRAVPMRPTTQLLLPLVAQVLAPREILLRERQVHVSVEIPPDLEVYADADRLRQVLDNLVDNAAKYSPQGGCLTVGASLDEGSVRIWVRDEGPGIPAEAVTRVFERFYRVDKMRSRELGGTG